MVIGESVQADGKTDMHVAEIGADGALIRERTIDFTFLVNSVPFVENTISIRGQAVQLNSDGNLLVLGAIQDVTDNMVLAELNIADLSISWAKKYGAGASTLSNKIYLDGSNNIFWSGTVTRSSSDIRLVKAGQNSLNTLFDLPIGKSDFQESGNDICRFGYGFAVVGTTNEKVTGPGDQDILFKILTESGTELLSKSIAGNGDVDFKDTDTGNSICSARGGMVILGTVKIGTQDDYYLMKYDVFGNPVWDAPRIFGSEKRNDAGVSVSELSDGSLLILGNSNFGGVSTMMLMKANGEGEIE